MEEKEQEKEQEELAEMDESIVKSTKKDMRIIREELLPPGMTQSDVEKLKQDDD